HEAALTERGPAVEVAGAIGFPGEVEGPGPRAERHLGGLVVEGLVVLDERAGTGPGERGLQVLEQSEAAVEPRAADGQGEGVRRLGRVGEDERRVGDAGGA